MLIVVVGGLLGPDQTTLAQVSPNLKMGNPSGARADVSLKDNFLLDRTFFATSYDNAKGTPNWVSWRLAKEDLGTAPRDNFYADPDLPAGFLQVDPGEYTGSGFDRGHMCPHGDRTATAASSLATFAMTNVIPQSHDVNTMAWETLENYCRDLVQTQGKTCYIIDGPAGQGGTGKNGLKPTTPDGKVVVPGQNWKVIMVLNSDVATAAALTANSAIRLIAVIMPNADKIVTEDWTPFLTTVNQVEALTGHTFFDAVDPAVINPLKGRTDPGTTEFLHLVRGRTGPVAPVLLVQQPAPQAPARVEKPAMLAIPAVPAMPAIAALTKATEGLFYPSETDEPFEVFTWGGVPGPMTDTRLWNLAGQDPRARLERVPLDPFFARLVAPRHPQGQVTPAIAGRYSALLATLKAELTDIEVIKFGQAEVAIYIFGRTRDGKLVGIKTVATET